MDIAVFMDDIETWDYDQIVRAVMHVQDSVGYDVELHLLAADLLDHPEPASFAHHIVRHGVHVYGETPEPL